MKKKIRNKTKTRKYVNKHERKKIKKHDKIKSFIKKAKNNIEITPDLKKKENIRKIIESEIKSGSIDIDTPVKNIMSTNLRVVEVGQNLREVIELLGEFEITGAPVKQGNRVVGVISDADIMKIMKAKGILDPVKDEVNLQELEKIKVESIMRRPPITINQNEKITDASDLMIKNDVNRLIVVDDNNKTVGIITREDVLKGLTTEFFIKSMKRGGGNIIDSSVDLVLSVIRNKGTINIKNLSKEVKMNIKDIEDLLKVLENRGLIEIEYPLIGYPKVKVKT